MTTIPAKIGLSILIGGFLASVIMPLVIMVAHELGVLGNVTGKILVWGTASLCIMGTMAVLYGWNYKEEEARRLAAREST